MKRLCPLIALIVTIGLIPIALCSLVACGGTGRVVRVDGVESVIFSSAYSSRAGVRHIALGDVDGYWTPDRSNVEDCERVLAAYVVDHPGILPNLSDHHRQYAGIFVGDSPLIWVNLFCSRHVSESENLRAWRRAFVYVLDGGDCYAQAVYDIETEEILALHVQGES